MSLAIDVNRVSGVLLRDDGWHGVEQVKGCSTFDLDAYEYVEGSTERVLHAGGSAGVCPTGFVFIERGTHAVFRGPLTSVLAVRSNLPSQ